MGNKLSTVQSSPDGYYLPCYQECPIDNLDTCTDVCKTNVTDRSYKITLQEANKVIQSDSTSDYFLKRKTDFETTMVDPTSRAEFVRKVAYMDTHHPTDRDLLNGTYFLPTLEDSCLRLSPCSVIAEESGVCCTQSQPKIQEKMSRATREEGTYFNPCYTQTRCDDDASCVTAEEKCIYDDMYRIYNRNAAKLSPSMSMGDYLLLNKDQLQQNIKTYGRNSLFGQLYYADTHDTDDFDPTDFTQFATFTLPDQACLRIEPCDSFLKDRNLCCADVLTPPPLLPSNPKTTYTPISFNDQVTPTNTLHDQLNQQKQQLDSYLQTPLNTKLRNDPISNDLGLINQLYSKTENQLNKTLKDQTDKAKQDYLTTAKRLAIIIGLVLAVLVVIAIVYAVIYSIIGDKK